MLFQSITAAIIFLLTVGGSAETLMVLLNTNANARTESKMFNSDFIATFVAELIGILGMIICYVSSL